MKIYHFFFLVFGIILFLPSFTLGSICVAGDDAIADVYDSTLGWIDSQPPNQECIRGIYTNSTGGEETCIADPECDGKDTNTYVCNDAVGVGYCDFSCVYTTGQTCQIDCGADTLCDDKLPGEEFADPSGDGTVDYCGGGTLNYSCNYINQTICDASYGADTLCDGETKDTLFDFDTDGDVDLCNGTCSYFDCLNDNSSMCQGDEICNGTTCIQDPVCDVAYGSDPLCDGYVRNQTIDADSDGDLDSCTDVCSYFDCVANNDTMCQPEEICNGTICIQDPVCDVAYGSDPLCDGYTRDQIVDADSDGDLDSCTDACSYFDCVNDNSSMCQSDEECIGTTCVVQASDELFLQIEYDASGTNRLSENMSYGTENTYVLGVASQDRNSTTNEMQDYEPSLKVPLKGEPILLFFASAEDLETIEAKEQYINTRDFFNLKNPTFSDVSYDDTFYTPIAHLIYRDIVLNGSVNLYSGTHTLFIEKSGTDATGLPIVSVRTG